MNDEHETERYAPIDGFPDYLVTSKGRVFSLKYNKIRELKLCKNKDGYYYVNLCKNGKRIAKNVHRLVAQSFIPNPENKPQVNHIDENKLNNNVSNLEWVTCKENINHGTHNERVSKTNSDGRRKGINHPYSKSVIGFKIDGCGIKYYKYISECINDGFHCSDISNCCKGKLKSAKGYKWYYADEFFNKNK